MQKGHTPGPWWYDEHTECIGSPAGWICSLRDYGERKSDIPFGGQINDANLIAISPDMLAFCRVLYAEVGKGGDLDWHLRERGYAERLRVLIEKADGG